MAQPPPPRPRSAKANTLAVIAVFVLSVSGYFIGLRQTVREQVATPALDSDPAALVPEVAGTPSAPTYESIREAEIGPNSDWQSRLSDLWPAPTLFAAIDSELLRVRRQERRAYDGAPPVVPHPIDQTSAETCLQCHQDALPVGDVVASAISHPVYASCTQCHVSAKGLGSRWNTSDFDLHTGNRFSGRHAAMLGERAYPDSPPTIPHAVHMRQNCLSCHGELGTSPIRTTHPERQSCVQCHVPGSEVDESNFAESPFPLIQALVDSEVQ